MLFCRYMYVILSKNKEILSLLLMQLVDKMLVENN